MNRRHSSNHTPPAPDPGVGEERERTSLAEAGSPLPEPSRPFRLVKYFSITGFLVITISTLVLTIFISHQGKVITQNKSLDYARLLADNLNHQVFLQFVIPTALRYGRVRLREPEQQSHLDTVVRNIIHSFQVMRVNIYDLEGTISYSTDKTLVGTQVVLDRPYQEALTGSHSVMLLEEPGQKPFGLDKRYILKTFFPFRAEQRMRGPVGEVLGVFEIDQDLTGDYAEITKFQYLSVAISLGFAGLIFLVLRQIIVRGERIIEQRNQEQRQLEEKLHHHQRLAALGQMIAAVAHEVRNPLGIISSTAEILQNKIKSYEPHNRLAEVIVQEAQRLNGIVTEFLDFARPQVPEPSVCDLEGVLEKNLAFLNPLFEKENIEIVKDYEFHHNIRADADLLYRAFLNVFMNAVQAMDGGGRLRVATRSVRDQGRDWAEVVVEDSGQGLDPEQAKTVFSPFFTTKNRGTGLGLAIVKNIIDGHQGEVDLSALPEGGARFTARLPVS